jgi:hypothetical protein
MEGKKQYGEQAILRETIGNRVLHIQQAILIGL